VTTADARHLTFAELEMGVQTLPGLIEEFRALAGFRETVAALP
jgi:hypothetical protein